MSRREGLVWLCVWLLSPAAGGQELVLKDSMILVSIKNLADPGISLVKFRINQEFSYSCTFANILFMNWQHGDHLNLVSLLHHINYRSQVTNNRNISINNSFEHDLGIQYFFDSISQFQPDENTMETRISIRIRKNFSISFFSNITTRIFNSYLFTTGQSGDLLTTLSASFLTPFIWTFSTGLGWTFPRLGTLSLGLSAAKFTWICNRDVFETLGVEKFYGVPEEKLFIFEYGLGLHLLVEKNFMKRVSWNCDLQIFKNYQKPVDLIMKSLIGIRINRFLKTSIQTRLNYEKDVSSRIQVENIVSLGFYFDL